MPQHVKVVKIGISLGLNSPEGGYEYFHAIMQRLQRSWFLAQKWTFAPGASEERCKGAFSAQKAEPLHVGMFASSPHTPPRDPAGWHAPARPDQQRRVACPTDAATHPRRVACPRSRGHVLKMQGGIRRPMATLCVAMPPTLGAAAPERSEVDGSLQESRHAASPQAT